MTLPESVGGGDLGHLSHHQDLHDRYNGPAPNTIKTDNYTCVLADANTVIEMNSSSTKTITIPTNASVPYEIGAVLVFFGMGTGTVTITGDSGVTVWSPHGDTGSRNLAGQYAEASARKRDTDIWVLAGDLE